MCVIIQRRNPFWGSSVFLGLLFYSPFGVCGNLSGKRTSGAE